MKKILTLVLCLVISAAFFIPVLAEEDDELLYPDDGYVTRVVDLADVFTDEEEAELTERVEELVEEYDISYLLLTNRDNGGLTAEEFSSDFLYYGDYDKGTGGAVVFYLSLDPEDRCWLTTSIGSYEDIFNSDVTYVIDEMVEEDIKDGNYYEAFSNHITLVDDIFQNEGELSDYYYDKYGSNSEMTVQNILICLAVGAFIGLVVGAMRLSSCKKAMRVVVPVDAKEYLIGDSFKLRNKKTYYLYSTVTKTAKQKSSGSSGGSTFSRGSSSGGSYSSGGRRF